MDVSTGVILILVLLVASSGIVATIYVLLKKYFDHQKAEQEQEWKAKRRNDYLPTQMQAYERLILLLERINPERLVFTASKPGMSARMLQSAINKIIREEYDHNLTQQLYISSEAWEAVKAARDEVSNILGVAAERVHRDADALEFSKAILEVTGSMNKLPSEVAIGILKSEFRKKMKL